MTFRANRITLNPHQARQLGARVRKARLEMGMTQLEVADEALGFEKSHAFVSRIERAVLNDVPVERLEKVARVLQANPNEWLGAAYSELKGLPVSVSDFLIEIASRYKAGELSARQITSLRAGI